LKKSIVWFKTDLRLHDNETLVNAIIHSDEVLPVYCWDESHFKKTAFGFDKTGNFRTQFLLESITDLDKQLRALGSGLLILQGNTALKLSELVHTYGAQKVYAKKEVSYEEKNTEASVEKEIWKEQCSLEVYSTSTLYHAEDLPFTIKDIPDVFTAFRKKTEQESNVRPIFETPKSIQSPTIKPIELPNLAQLGLSPVKNDVRKCFDFIGGESEGFKRLNYYFKEAKSISTYKKTRNELLGAEYSTKFSAWLALGCLSPREIYYELKKYEAIHGQNESTYWLVFELFWRDYFRFMMKKHRSKFFMQAGIKNSELPMNVHKEQILQQWINGKTGNNFVDTNMLELKYTGYMSNRGRQNVASYLVNNLKLDWRYGAAYFEQQLIDYDVSSNWGNWAYLAGVGNDPRGQRQFNIEKQAAEYDKNSHYQNLWLGK